MLTVHRSDRHLIKWLAQSEPTSQTFLYSLCQAAIPASDLAQEKQAAIYLPKAADANRPPSCVYRMFISTEQTAWQSVGSRESY